MRAIGWLVDTNVLSEGRKLRASEKVRAFMTGQNGPTLYTSEVTLAEILFGIRLVKQPEFRDELSRWTETVLQPFFGERCIAVTRPILVRWFEFLKASRIAGEAQSPNDLLIAATADVHRLIVVSRDTSAFVAAGVPVLDPWKWTLHVGHRVAELQSISGSDSLAQVNKILTGRSQKT